jgi:small subunit ribosomal protein S20
VREFLKLSFLNTKHPMANSKQAEKRGRQTLTRTAHNSSIKTRVKSSRKALAAAVEAGDKDTAAKKLVEVASAADRAAKNGVIHTSAAGRIKSRSTQAVAKLG